MRFLEHGVAHNHWLAPVTLKEVTAILDDFDALGLAMAKMQAKTICSGMDSRGTELKVDC